ncbi:hypothetical protein vseg_007523 [Gypsophila vaccaria]
MASGRDKSTIFCHDRDIPQNRWCLKDPTCAKTCDTGFSAVKEETYCERYHRYDDGWKECDRCGKNIHYECIMALNTFRRNDTHSITCKECVEKENLMPPNSGASSSIQSPVNCSRLNDSNGSSVNCTGEEILTDRQTATIPNNGPQSLGNAAVERSSEQSTPPKPGLTFLFEKKLSATDCRVTGGRLLIPKNNAERFFPILPEQPKTPLVIKDAQGHRWKVNVCASSHGNSRKYEMDGIRKCIRQMQWKTGDTLKFYRQPDGDLFMEHVRRDPGQSTS